MRGVRVAGDRPITGAPLGRAESAEDPYGAEPVSGGGDRAVAGDG